MRQLKIGNLSSEHVGYAYLLAKIWEIGNKIQPMDPPVENDINLWRKWVLHVAGFALWVHRKGLYRRKIATLMGISVGTIDMWLHRNSIPDRRLFELRKIVRELAK